MKLFKKLLLITTLILSLTGIVWASNALINRTGITLDLNMGNNDGGATPVVYDTSGNGANATAANAMTCNNDFCDFDGSADYMTGTATGLFNSSEISIAIKFSPDFEADNNVSYYFYHTSSAGYLLNKVADNTIRIDLANTPIVFIPLATYQPYWKTGQENIIIVTGDDTNNLTNAWLNGNQILTDDTTAFTNADPATIYIGSTNVAASKFDGKIHYLKVWNRLLTNDEVANLSADRKVKVQSASRTGLVGYWNMDSNDINGTTVYDKSGEGNDGTSANTPVSVVGKVKQAMDFDGSTQRVDVGSITTGDWTISTWVKKVTYNSVLQYIVGFETNKGIFVSGGTGIDKVGIFDGTGVFESTTVLDLNKWYLITATQSGTTVNIYLNDTGTILTQTVADIDIGDFSIGKRADSFGFFDGDIDEVKIFNYALSATEISNLYNASKTSFVQAPTRTGLVGYWNMDSNDVNGTTVYDKSGQGNDGTSANTPVSVVGKVKQGMSFNGSSDVITITDPADGSLDFGTGEFSVSWWAKPTNTGAYNFMISKYPPTATDGGWDFEINASGIIDFVIRNNTTEGSNSRVSNVGYRIDDGKWHHFTATRSDQLLTVYIDGMSVGSNSGLVSGANISNSIDLWIGGRQNPSFTGDIDEVRIYNTALSATEITNLYEAGRINLIK